MTLEIIKWLFAIKASVHGLAGGGAKLADQLCMKRMAAGTLNSFLPEHFGGAKLLLRIGRGDTKGF